MPTTGAKLALTMSNPTHSSGKTVSVNKNGHVVYIALQPISVQCVDPGFWTA